MTLDELIKARKTMGLSQGQVASRMGIGVRAYQEIEAGRSELRNVHIAAIERASIALAVETGDPMLALPGVRRQAFSLAAAMDGMISVDELECRAALLSIASYLRNPASRLVWQTSADSDPQIRRQLDLIANRLITLSTAAATPSSVRDFEELNGAWRDLGVHVSDDLVQTVVRCQLAIVSPHETQKAPALPDELQ